MKKEKKIENWEKEFDEQFGDPRRIGDDNQLDRVMNYEAVKSFIRQLLNQVYREGFEKRIKIQVCPEEKERITKEIIREVKEGKIC